MNFEEKANELGIKIKGAEKELLNKISNDVLFIFKGIVGEHMQVYTIAITEKKIYMQHKLLFNSKSKIIDRSKITNIDYSYDGLKGNIELKMSSRDETIRFIPKKTLDILQEIL